MGKTVKLVYPVDSQIAVVNKKGFLANGEPVWVRGAQWFRRPDGKIEATYDRDNAGTDEMLMCLAASGTDVSKLI